MTHQTFKSPAISILVGLFSLLLGAIDFSKNECITKESIVMAVLKMKQNYVYDLDDGFEDFLSNRKMDKDVSEDTIKSYKDHLRTGHLNNT